MLGASIAVSVSLLLAVLSEYLWQKKIIKGEPARKFLHILIGTWTATWPWFMSFRWIMIIALGGIAFNLFSQKYHIFHAIYAVKRRSIGDYIVAFGIALTALYFQDKLIFALAVLHLSLADGVAALVGKRYGKTNQYKVFGSTKSVAGSLAFFGVSVVLQSIFYIATLKGAPFDTVHFLTIIPIALAGMVIESVSIYGTDNLTIPVSIAWLLRVFMRI